MSASKPKSATIKSIAEELGISFSTVSKALNDSPLVKEETRTLVLQKAKEVGYVPNALAKSLRGSSTKTIAAIFNDIENPALTYIFRNISVEMANYGYTTMILDSQFNEKVQLANIQTALSRRPDFVILEPAGTGLEGLNLLEGLEQKLVLQGARYGEVNCHHIYVDYARGGYLAAYEMLSNGHRDCLILADPPEFPISEQFLIGIRQAYREFGVPFKEEMVKVVSPSIASGYLLLQSLWEPERGCFSQPFTGVITFNDMLAFGVYQAAAQFGLQVPEDISVVGFDDNPLSAFADPPLTTVHLPKEKMAESYLDILRNVLLKGAVETGVYSLEPHMIRRSSVCNRLKKKEEQV